MNPEAQRIAIAEACGWRCTASFKEAFACWVRPDGMDHQTEWLPDYLNDLNAMHEAEKRLFDTHESMGVSVYYHLLIDLCSRNAALAVQAPANIRAEAFLCTLGKWEEDK